MAVFKTLNFINMGCGNSTGNASQVSVPTGITLHYFDIYGRGELIRMILAFHGATYNDNRIAQDKWPGVRDSGFAEFDELPCVEMDGKKFVETRSIARYLCLRFGYYPMDVMDSYLIESICELKSDVFGPALTATFKRDTEALTKIYDDMPWYLKKIEARLVRNNGGRGWFVGNSVSLADFEIFHLLWDLLLRPEKRGSYEHIVLTHAPKLKEFVDRFLNFSPRLNSYLASRPPRPL